ncbi:transcriptional regulator with XRE-family HTH domain [Evansella vedderi]|uniref:Transcriptional regulator with XRE-family HTH domain n=1 Tax=Evansella vedderi TaxID=38282 RepID=A0ABT9ZTB6_9BACI|nr:helix-turn-helix transcriptional regulator [Evansella vedderi]MDQ0254481.1 transcriptional regulator with XRE-family HTH domain [Evansella vedderi]
MKRKEVISRSLGRVIQKRRKNKDFKQWKLAEEADIDIGYLSQVERGKKNPTYDMLYRISIALGTLPSSISKEVEDEVIEFFSKAANKNKF